MRWSVIGMKLKKAYELLKSNPKNIRYEDLCQAAEAYGFRLKGGKGSHRVYTREGVREILNFQDVNGRAKPYQVRQLLKVIEMYNLTEDDDAV
ncbi:MAG: hypothetical protein PWP08_551 [Methanofollis sp.]|nr:hypothetical protein [Methanofollis sp.]